MKLSKNKKLLITIVAILAAVALVAYGLWGFFRRHQAMTSSESAQTADAPSEKPPSETCEEYEAAPHEPHKIELSDIGITGCVQKVGLDKDGAIAAPNNIHVAGWYTASPAPGQPGISIVDGHVSGHYDDGIFAQLNHVSVGNMINIRFGDGREQQFEVVEVASYPVNEATDQMFQPLSGVDSQLTLITCGGTFDKQSQTYSERVIVRAKPQGHNRS